MNHPHHINMNGQSQPGLSVIICCYNSALRLPETLKHLANQVVPEEIAWEILLIDNASTDHTAMLALEIWNQLKPGSTRLRVLQEPRAGQMFARIHGAKAARHDLLIFCDDDNWLGDQYVYYANKIIRENDQIGAAGGQNKPTTDTDQYPEWFEMYKDKYALGIPAEASGDVTRRGFVLGAGLLTQTALFLEVYAEKYPSLLKGRNGENLSTGDDFEYCKRLILRGYHLYYSENLKLIHFIPKERLSVNYRDRLMQGIQEAGRVLNEYDLAIRVVCRFKNKSRTRLLLLTPFRIALCRLGLSKRVLIDEERTLFYLSPFQSNKNSVRNKIKDFIYRR